MKPSAGVTEQEKGHHGGGHSHPAHRMHGGHVHDAAGGASARDPVCGMNVALGAGKPSLEHAGRTYHFCSRKCLDKFEANPSAYLAGADEAKVPAAPKGTV